MELASLLSHPSLYLLWQRPFVGQKLAPFKRRHLVDESSAILDLGCGPGTNRTSFKTESYVGVDLDPNYIDWAKKTLSGKFICADASKLSLEEGSKFDLIIANSLFHHLSEQQVQETLRGAKRLLKENGRFYLIDLVLPAKSGIARFLTERDRGEFPRDRERLLSLIESEFTVEYKEDFALKFFGITCWEMIYIEAA